MKKKNLLHTKWDSGTEKPLFAAILLSSRGSFNDAQRAFQHREDLQLKKYETQLHIFYY